MLGIEIDDIDPSLKEVIRNIRLIAFDFDGVFTDNMVYVLQDGSEAVRCCRGDGIGLQKLKKMGIETVIISTEANPVVSARARKLNIRCLQDCEDKRTTLESIARKSGISLKEVAFIGNDINDLECLSRVGLPIIVNDAHQDVVSIARYQTRNPGGCGAVREICDLFEQTLAT
ncbi:MAG: HAD hydrolase family protein [Deltaproteobacteria bacterium]|jgi:YrbI family 3-deoxy-D-manno-octulosonate 8-phosphate phosphatase|nr:HAD hydrolase family protein [Deltaproteobacteria bacterium]